MRQTEAAIESPASPIVANFYIESFERQAITTAANQSIVWYRYVYDTLVQIHDDHL